MNLKKRLAKCKYYLYNDPKFRDLIDRENSYLKDLSNFLFYYADLQFTLVEVQYFTCGVKGRWLNSNSIYKNENDFFSLGLEFFESKK
jgi:hypothetical protein